MQIRVVNAFRQGVDPRLMERTNPALAAVLQRQASASLAKRLSQASSIDYADAPGATGIGERERDYLAPEVDMERLSSRSHTETAVWGNNNKKKDNKINKLIIHDLMLFEAEKKN